MRRTSEITVVLAVAVLAVLAIGVAVWLMESCYNANWRTIINQGSGGSCFEFWVNRYQTLLTGLAALIAALITVGAMHRHAETARADEAERALTRYAVAILEVMDKHEEATPARGNETRQDAEKRLQALYAAAADATVRSAMIDSVLGRDQAMVAMFVNCCRMSAAARVYGQPEDRRHQNMIWPLYTALSDGINQRRARLREGARVSDLYTLSTIDQTEVRRAFVEERMPELG